jgi:4-amino-4-deoxy-L-arabinose transferase-like glycosyltransferase
LRSVGIFFLIIALTSLCKGLIGAVVPALVILPDLIKNNEWKKHLRLSFVAGMIPAAIVYVLPFWASAYFGGEGYGQNGLYLVYKENVLRYFQPFDHKGPIYTYFIFLPVYLLPWAFFFIPALCSLKSRWSTMSSNSKWIVWSVLLLFLFLTLSGSRRNYYVLPLVPFAILMTADWILSAKDVLAKRSLWAGRVVVIFFAILFLVFNVVQPLYYAEGGMDHFAANVQQEMAKTKPAAEWQFVLLDAQNKIRFYLQLPPSVKEYSIQGERAGQSQASLLQSWPMLATKQPNVIYISRKMFEPYLRAILVGYRVVETPQSLGQRLLNKVDLDDPIAFIP